MLRARVDAALPFLPAVASGDAARYDIARLTIFGVSTRHRINPSQIAMDANFMSDAKDWSVFRSVSAVWS